MIASRSAPQISAAAACARRQRSISAATTSAAAGAGRSGRKGTCGLAIAFAAKTEN